LNKKDAGVTNNTTDDPSLCASLSSNGICLTPQKNALNRIRRSGIVKKDYSIDNRQYLEKRSKTFYQNQYSYLVKGDPSAKPGSANSIENTYSNGCRDVVYKPNNSNFACQGAVSSSSLILRKKYVAITSNASKYLMPYGAAVSDAMAYSISDSVYTYKNKFAFPTKITPMSRKNTNTMQFCENVRSKVI
jgi:predicted nucleic acid binding AN1-type Zn finger protein